MFDFEYKRVKILFPISLIFLLVFSIFFSIGNVLASERPSVITNPFCSLTWDDPKDGSGNGLRKIGENDSVTFNVSGLSPNQSFTVKNFHNLSSFTKTGGTQNTDDSGAWSLYDQTPILDSEYGEHLGTYTTKIVDSSGNPIATCGGFTLTKDVAPMPSCSLSWDAPTDSSGNGLRKLGEFDDVTINISGLSPNQEFTLKNFHNSSSFTKTGGTQNANSSGVWSLSDHTKILASEYDPNGDGLYLGIYTTKIIDSSGSPIATCGYFTLSKDTPPHPTNTPPTIVLVGSDPLNLNIGATFADPGATATDAEDGNLTASIVTTGSVNTSVVGTYTITYSVTDTGGLSATTTRTVVVSTTTPPSNININISATKIVCDNESDLPNWGLGGPNITANTASQFLDSHQSCRKASDWKFQWASSTASDPGSSFIGEADGWHTFGPTDSLGIATTTISVSPTTPRVWFREVLKTDYLGFSTVAENNPDSAEMYCNTDVLNYDNYDLIANPFVDGATYYCVAFNVLISTPPPSPPTNTPPVITLLGANPFSLTVGNTFTDPGATSTDAEDGNLTSQIVVTGAVNTSLVGTYTLTYVVRDSGNLYATTTRTVVVNPSGCTSNCGGNHQPTVSLSSSPSTITLGATSTLSWTSANANSCSAIWTSATSTNGSQIVSPLLTTSYAITCVGSVGSSTAITTVVVSSSTPPVVPPITPPPVNPPTNNGGGGGNPGGHRHPVVVGEILGATSCLYLRDYLKIDWKNDPVEVLKLQAFLNVFEKENLSFTGKFDQATFEAVQRFQVKYASDILEPWGDKVTTGFVYILTKKKVNEIYCNTVLSLSQADQVEIEVFKSSGVSVSGGVGRSDTDTSLDKGQNIVEVTAEGSTVSRTKTDIPIVELVASSSKSSVAKDAAISLFAIPQKVFTDWKYFLAFLLLVVIVIVVIRTLGGGDDDDDIAPPKSSGTDQKPPIIILPGASESKDKTPEILPDEEIIVENPEEGLDETIITSPDFNSPSAEQEDERG